MGHTGTVAATVANHTLWEIELMAVVFVVFAVAVLAVRRTAARRGARLRRAGAFGYHDHDVLERGLGPTGFGAVSATVTTYSTPLAPSFGSPGSTLPGTSGPAPSLAQDFNAATDQTLLPGFVVPDGQGDDRGPAPGWALPPELASVAHPPTPVRERTAPAARRSPGSTPVAPPEPAPPVPGEPPAGTPASWLPDPSGVPGLLRYWDGAMWTARTSARR